MLHKIIILLSFLTTACAADSLDEELRASKNQEPFTIGYEVDASGATQPCALDISPEPQREFACACEDPLSQSNFWMDCSAFEGNGGCAACCDSVGGEFVYIPWCPNG